MYVDVLHVLYILVCIVMVLVRSYQWAGSSIFSPVFQLLYRLVYSVEDVKGELELYSSLHFCSYCKEKETEAGCLFTDPARIDPFLVTFMYLSVILE